MDIIRDCDQCGHQFQGDSELVVEECPQCGRMVNYILEDDDPRVNRELHAAASTLGRKGGSAKSEAKTQASRDNGKKGGRPKTARRGE